MNERLKELMNKATTMEEHGWGASYENFERLKFAEMVVRECVGIVAKRKDQAIDDECNVDEAMSVAEMDLLEHFGVEE